MLKWRSTSGIFLVPMLLCASEPAAAGSNPLGHEAELEWATLEQTAEAAMRREDSTTAIAALERALALARRFDRADLEARAHNGLAHVHAGIGNVGREITHLRGAADGFRRAKTWEPAAASLLELGRVYLKEGVTSRALATFDTALSMASQHGLTAIEKAALEAQLAALEQAPDPRKQNEVAEQLIDVAVRSGDPELEARARERRENAQALLGMFDDPQLATGTGDAETVLLGIRLGLQGFALRELARQLAEDGDLEGGIDLVTESLLMARQQRSTDMEKTALETLGGFYLSTGETDDARGAYQQMEQLARQLGDERTLAHARMLLGNVLLFEGDVESAEATLLSGLETATKMGDSELEALAHNSLGLVEVNRGDLRAAVAHIRRGLQLHPSLPGLENLAWLLASAGETDAALQMAEDSLRLLEKAENGLDRAGANATRGFVLFCARRWEEAEASLRRSIAEYERLWKGLEQAEELEIASRDLYSHPYELLQRVLIRQNKHAEALEAAERARARTFARTLGQRWRGGELPEAPTIEEIRSLASESRTTLVVYSLLYEPTRVLVADRIGGEQAEYEEMLVIWVVTPAGEIGFEEVDLTSLRRAAHPTSLAQTISRCREALTTKGRGASLLLKNRPETTVSERLAELSALLIRPVAKHLANPQNAGDEAPRIVFVPQGPLFLVPFAALPGPDGRPLVERFTVSTAPSIGVLLGLRGGPMPGTWSADDTLVVGDPTMPPALRLSPLPQARLEAAAVALRFGAQPLVGEQATQTAVVSTLPDRKLVHLATHGLLEYGEAGDVQQAKNPGALVFSSETGDGLLMASEIAEMKLSADLVVLSACDTGRGRLTGDGIVGLSRSFLTAGAASVIVSLWQLDDSSTTFLMERFYEALATTHDEARALRRAMLATREQFEDPAYWAGFTSIGAIR